jgi:hypothetical protein
MENEKESEMTESQEEYKAESAEKLPVLFAGDASDAHPLARYGENKVVRIMADRIMALDKRKEPLNKQEALLYAQAAIAYRLDPFGGELWAWIQKYSDGRRFLTIMKGRDGTLKIAKQNAERSGTYLLSPRFQMVIDEARLAQLKVPPGALVFECFQEDYESITLWQERYNKMVDAGAKHNQIVELIGDSPADYGLGILTVEEMESLDKGQNKMTHVERCQKRAHMASLRKRWAAQEFGEIPNASTNTEDYLIEGEWLELEPPKIMGTDEEKEARASKGKDTLYGETKGKPDRSSPSFWPKEVLAAIIENNYSENEFHAAGMLKYSAFDRSVAIGPALVYAKHYLAARDEDHPSQKAGEIGMAAYLKTLKRGKEDE